MGINKVPIVSLGKSLDPDVSGKDVVELVDEYMEELTTGEFKMPSSMFKNICSKCSQVQSFVERHHSNIPVTRRVVNMFNSITLSHFRRILKRIHKPTSLVFSGSGIHSVTSWL